MYSVVTRSYYVFNTESILPNEFTSCFSGVRVTWSLVLCVCFVYRCFPFVIFLLAIVLSVLLSFGHCVVCPSVFWPLCYLSFCLLAIVLSVLLSFGHCVICSLSFGHCVICFSVFWPLCYLFFFDLRQRNKCTWTMSLVSHIHNTCIYNVCWCLRVLI